MKMFALTSLAMAIALTVQAQAEEQVPPPPAGPYQSFALMPEAPQLAPHPRQFPPINYHPEPMQAPEPPAWVKERPQSPTRPDWAGEMPAPREMGQTSEMPEPPAWVKERSQPPTRPDWAGEMPEPGEMGQPPEMPEPPAWVKERPQPPARPDWVGQMPPPRLDRPCSGYQGDVSERPCRRFSPEMRERPNPPAWVQGRPEWPEMRAPERPDFQRPVRPSPWERGPYSDRGFPPTGYERQLMPKPPAPPLRYRDDRPREPYTPGYYPYPRR